MLIISSTTGQQLTGADGAIKDGARRFSTSFTLPHYLLNLIIVLLPDVFQLLLKLGLHYHQLFLGASNNLQLILYRLCSNCLQLRVPLCTDLIENPVVLFPDVENAMNDSNIRMGGRINKFSAIQKNFNISMK